MMYAVLCYNDEKTVWSWSKQEEEAVMARLEEVRTRLVKTGKMGTSLRLLPTTAATTLRKTQDPPLVIDGPFAETKEQLLGFYVIDVADLDAALDVARELAAVNPGGAYEVRPIALYKPDERAMRWTTSNGSKRRSRLRVPRRWVHCCAISATSTGRRRPFRKRRCARCKAGHAMVRRAIPPRGSSWSGATPPWTMSARPTNRNRCPPMM